MKCIGTLGFCCVFSLSLLAQQNATIDSLEKELARPFHDSVKAKILFRLAEESFLADPGLAGSYCRKAYALSEKMNYSEGLVTACGWLAYLNEQEGKITQAIEFYERGLELAQKTADKKSEAVILNNLGAIYKDRGKIDSAIIFHHKSLSIRKLLGDKIGEATSYNNLGLISFNQGKVNEALNYYSQALRVYEREKDDDGISTALNNMAGVYKEQRQFAEADKYYRQSLNVRQRANDKYGMAYALNGLGNLFEMQNISDSALSYYSASLALRKQISDLQGMAYSLKNIGYLFEKSKNYIEAKNHYTQSLDAFKEVDDKWGIASATNRLGGVLLELGDVKGAEKQLLNSLQLAKELGYPSDIQNAAGNLQKLYRNKSEWVKALDMFDMYLQMHDSVLNDNNRKASLRTQFQYEYEKKEAVFKTESALAQSEIARQKLLRNSFIGAFVIMLVFAGVFFYQRNRIAKEKDRSESLLLNILPAEVAEELKGKGKAEAKLFEHVTVLFADFKDFTTHSEKMTPQELVGELDACFKEFDEIVTEFGLEKIKTMGDAYLAVSGLPLPNPNHAVDVVNAALQIQEVMRKRKLQSNLREGLYDVRIGIHSGNVVAGIVGVKKFAYDIWGDTVNTAARMEQNSEAGKINISETTYYLVKDIFATVYRGEIEAKNKGKLKMYFVE